MTPEERIQEIDKQWEKLRSEKWKLEDAIRRKQLPGLVGKCYVYEKNCYSCPEKPSDYWNEYARLVAYKDGTAYAETFCVTKDGEFSFTPKTVWSDVKERTGWKTIPKKNYLRAKRSYLRSLEKRLGELH